MRHEDYFGKTGKYDNEAFEYLSETLGREPTDQEVQDYLEQQEQIAHDKYYDLLEDELQGN